MTNDTDTVSFVPLSSGGTAIDPLWIEARTSFSQVCKCTVEDISNQGRKLSTLKLYLTFEDGTEPCTLIIKQTPENRLEFSKMLGLAREGLFYKNLAPRVTGGSMIPKVHYSFGDISTGGRIVIMEDLSSAFLDSGILFGPGNPNNWNRDLPKLVDEAYGDGCLPPTSSQVANDTFLAIAKIHARFWKDVQLLDPENDFLRCFDWVQGKNRASWEASQGMIQDVWTQLQNSKSLDSRICWDPLVKNITARAMLNISWDAQQKRLNKNAHWTIVHGDFWPGNVLVSTKSTHDVKLLDWEMVGIGSGPQDLGQYIISNMEPNERRDCERQLVERYYAELVRCGVQNYAWEECWDEYRLGGLERWLWFLVYFLGQTEGPMSDWAQFFHDQIAAFVQDHQITPDEIVQPRP